MNRIILILTAYLIHCSVIGQNGLPIISKPKVNQLGYLPNAKKTAVAPSMFAEEFCIINTNSSDTVLKGQSSAPNQWTYSKENVIVCDFSSLKTPGEYQIVINGTASSPFSIENTTYQNCLQQVFKSFYYQRASFQIDEGEWQRLHGHPDTSVLVHASAATINRPVGTKISAPKGWYDAGDYNKYIVPAGITVWQMAEAYKYVKNQNIVLDNVLTYNDLPEIIDEIMWEVDWMLAMQDEDGGVYHKLTTANFENTIMPSTANSVRYVTQKSTAAALIFSATLAKVASVLKNENWNNTAKINSITSAAEKAWNWANANPNIRYDQNQLNIDYSPKVVTGDYGLQSYNPSLADEKLWASTQLYQLTKNQNYLNEIVISGVSDNLPTWSTSQFLALLEIMNNPNNFPNSKVEEAKNKILNYANRLVKEHKESAYSICMGENEWDFSWNSNATACNQSSLLYYAYQETQNQDYLKAAQDNLSYVLGMNPLDKCFVTGNGSNPPKNIHHRISAADGITNPIPGFLSNGPHARSQQDCGSYPSTEHAFSYKDEYCSYSTNEIAIYVNSSILLALSQLAYEPSSLNTKEVYQKKKIRPYPNPTTNRIKLGGNFNWKLFDQRGILIKANSGDEINMEPLAPGIYYLVVPQHTCKITKI